MVRPRNFLLAHNNGADMMHDEGSTLYTWTIVFLRRLSFTRTVREGYIFVELDPVKGYTFFFCVYAVRVRRSSNSPVVEMHSVAQGGYRGFIAKNTVPLTAKGVDHIHKRGGTVLGTSRGGHDTMKIVDSIQECGINQVYIIGGDGTQKGAAVIYEEIRKRGLKVVVAGIPKTIDNDIPVIDRSFGFDTAVEEAQRAINAAHVEAESAENGIGVVKLMGRYSGFIAMYATLASRDVDCSEGAGQELLVEKNEQDASGNKLLQDVGLWITQKIKEHFAKRAKPPITLKYIDPTYMIRAIPSNAADNVYCTLLAQSAVHGAMAGPKETDEFKKEQGPQTPLLDDARDSGKGNPGKNSKFTNLLGWLSYGQ
ncbi:ATP-dependent 6-phosphofructokinase [Sesamum angolense]|uniref:ATP-dependent 6-phosphofructokinase n=1 Tax=Sesamum angolense TaxID=2727404 RepID=A0AAE1X6H3_9LAMI|nr:ATP-dependent 6-phosphofructokinase [Sesamum angolense]